MRKLGMYSASSYLALSLLAVMPGFARQSGQKEDCSNSIVGTWIITVTVNTPPGAPPFVFTDMFAFNSGGTLTAASSLFNAHTSENPSLPAPLVVDTSDGYGAWKNADDDSIALIFRRFLFAGANTSTALYPWSFLGQYIGVNAIQAVGRVSADGGTFSGSFTNQFLNLGGAVVFAGSGTFSGTRLKIEPLTP
ncbi:MAG: hypothetical protein JO270_14675 [Acidobacteriaceae bacterium]|nr:hypothetical protein [Acidobacteriaceae bacterium]